ncbi:FAD-dependent oxidoreductase [Roseimicrobium sp. ORNL1]|uniref:FAD-dependent oxidoreductase n=1 Tax=Roseimicrobium sp. ORNL1 TaxID=2711231 RepID=UPI0013E1929C|nr:FAD-dependent oxidoreductase [Roseimicrobium sp. ORNL1]QIF03318.1 FAD-dependent oxidoreductase [Roseimicrobium sp. ORNL1]
MKFTFSLSSLRKLLSVVGLGCLTVSGSITHGAPATSHDLVVYGGTPGGIACAIAAAREGKSVLLLETTKHLGGLTTGGLSHTDVGPRPELIGGIAKEFFTQADALYADPKRTASKDFWYQEPHIAEKAFTTMLQEAKVEVIFGARVKSVEKKEARISSITTLDGKTYAGRIFVDASYEGDVMALAKVDFYVGREGREAFDEPLAGFRPAPFRFREQEYMASPDRKYTHGTPAKMSAYGKDGKLLPGINTEWPELGAADNKSQAYNFRVILTNNAANRLPIPKPANYDPLRYEILDRIIDAFPGVKYEKLVFLGALPNQKFDANASGLVQGTDHVGGNVDYPDGDYATRDRIWQDHREYVQGFLWFLANDPRVPADLRAQASEYGLAKDEFTDNENWPYQLYVREARRMRGQYVMSQRDCQKAITKPDSIGMGAFILDSHAVQRLVDKEGFVIDEGNFDIPVRPYQIPYRSVTPKKEQCTNLLVPVALSATHVTYGSIRMEPQFMILGHSTGVAAAMALEKYIPVQDVDMAALRAKLVAQGQVLELASLANLTLAENLEGIVVDDEAATYEGSWTASGYGDPIDGTSHNDGDGSKGKLSARFETTLPESGTYEVRLAYSSAPNRANNVPVKVEHAKGSDTVEVNQQKAPPVEKYFASLGQFEFTKDKPAVVTVSNEGTKGFVTVDAVQWVRVK